MSDYRLEFMLQQITPFLHFQGEEEGACLRASEVKPKLDKFVLNYLKRKKVKIPDTWKLPIPNSDGNITYHHEALRYKMRFVGEPTRVENESHALYFGSKMKNTTVSKSVFYEKGIQMILISTVKERISLNDNQELKDLTLLKLLEKLLPAFFCLHCFGTRSNKGFGSFEISGKSLSAEELKEYIPSKCLALFNVSSKNNQTVRLDEIYVLSAMMKGGVNLTFKNPEAYYKGDIHTFLLKKRIGSEKAYLKSCVFSADDRSYYERLCKNKKDTCHQSYEQYLFIRAMLGLTDVYTFGVGNSSRKFSVKDVNDKIKRFANPIAFKPYKSGILIIVHEIPALMLGAKFQMGDSPNNVISTPSQFDIVQFTSDFLHQLNGKIENPFWTKFCNSNPFAKMGGNAIKFNDILSSLSLQSEIRL